ncbi:MAG: hypothetical protein U5K56_00275 [Halioglobus sp.]|nr:hypothetical protein [Halioglobus sp.]
MGFSWTAALLALGHRHGLAAEDLDHGGGAIDDTGLEISFTESRGDNRD